jgi:hypothetical protein
LSDARRFRVEIVFWEPTYARHSGRPPRIYRSVSEIEAVDAASAEESALKRFRAAEATSSVGWSRRIVKTTVRELGGQEGDGDTQP